MAERYKEHVKVFFGDSALSRLADEVKRASRLQALAQLMPFYLGKPDVALATLKELEGALDAFEEGEDWSVKPADEGASAEKDGWFCGRCRAFVAYDKVTCPVCRTDSLAK